MVYDDLYVFYVQLLVSFLV